MPRKELLSAVQRFELLSFPPLSERELEQHYLLTKADLERISLKKGPQGQLGFALQLSALRHLGRALERELRVPGEVLALLASQLRLDPACFSDYAKRDATRRERFQEACALEGFRRCTPEDEVALEDWLVSEAQALTQAVPLVRVLQGELLRRKVAQPALSHLERWVGRVFERVSLQTYEALLSGVDQVARARLDALLIPEPGMRVSRLSWLRQPSGKPSTGAMLALLERIDFLRDLRIDFGGP